MEKVIYDLHTHSALSPCGDNDMTVNNMLNMAVLGGIQVMAITDHNSCKNCPAAVEVAKELPIDLIPGMELCTSEEVHVICLFGQLEQAMAFDAYVHDHLPPVKNRPEIFGEQRILNAADEIIGYEPYLLINATAISIEEVVPLVRRFGGICYPAHIDKSSTSVFSNLGYFSAHWLRLCTTIWQDILKPRTLLNTSEMPSMYPMLQNSSRQKLTINGSRPFFPWSRA